MVTRILGATLSLLAFAIATLAGLSARNPLEVVLFRALMAMVVFFAVGMGLGWVIQRVIAEHLNDRRIPRSAASEAKAETQTITDPPHGNEQEAGSLKAPT